jgi:hypothetical protein
MKGKSFKFLFIYQAPQSGAKIEMKLKLHRPRPFYSSSIIIASQKPLSRADFKGPKKAERTLFSSLPALLQEAWFMIK